MTLRSAVSNPLLGFLWRYVIERAEAGALRTDDPDVPGAAAAYADPVMEHLLERLRPNAPTGDIELGVRSVTETYDFFPELPAIADRLAPAYQFDDSATGEGDRARGISTFSFARKDCVSQRPAAQQIIGKKQSAARIAHLQQPLQHAA